jgi:hypothetical protein
MITSFEKIFIYEEDPFEHYRMIIVSDLLHVFLCVATNDKKIFINQTDRSGSCLISYDDLPENSKNIKLTPKLIKKIKIEISNYEKNADANMKYNTQKAYAIQEMNTVRSQSEKNTIILKRRKTYL